MREPSWTPITPYGADPAGPSAPGWCAERPLAGVTGTLSLWPPRFTTTVTDWSTWFWMVLVRVLTSPLTGLPLTDTTMSPAFNPAAAAGLVFPARVDTP